MRPLTLIVQTACTMLLATGPSFAQQDAPPPTVEAQPRDVEAPITAVTLYPGRAAVTRTTALDLAPGVYDLRFADLPSTVQPDTLQARTGGGLKVLSVDYLEVAVADPAAAPEVAALDQRIRQLSQALAAMVTQRQLIASQEEFLAALTIRATSDASAAAGTAQLDLDTIKKQMDFISAERRRLLGEKSSLDVEQPKVEAELNAAQANRDAAAVQAGSNRMAVVSVVAADPFKGEAALTYLVSSATWEPIYNIRAADDLANVQVEYDAMLTQRTGEDWNDVRLTLSTAQPTLAANPPTLDPWFIDVVRPMMDGGMVSAKPAAPPAAGAVMRRADPMSMGDEKDKFAELKELGQDAGIVGSGPAVSFELPRAITVKTNIDRQQRTRISTIDSRAFFVHVATPLLSDAVYLRSDLYNNSGYQLLVGPAAIFTGHNYIGSTVMPQVAPGGALKVHFGIDPSVRIKRQLVNKTTESTGLLSGGRRTVFDYRITIDNGSGRELTLELWDRIPVSRNEEIQVQLSDLNVRLADDTHYVSELKPLGLLKWWLTVPASSRDLGSMVVSWSVHIDRAKDVQMTPLPE